MKLKNRIKIFLAGLLTPIILGYIFILSMHGLAIQTGLPGYRGGPQDAFRHTLASAYVSRYLGGWAVESFTEFSEKDSNSNYDLMDRHNNNIGKIIGLGEAPVYETVSTYVKNGQVNSIEIMTVRWLPQEKWGNFLGMK